MQTVVNKKELDIEWVTLIMNAKDSGLSKEEIRLFLLEMQGQC